jgi:hypothetical protein
LNKAYGWGRGNGGFLSLLDDTSEVEEFTLRKLQGGGGGGTYDKSTIPVIGMGGRQDGGGKRSNQGNDGVDEQHGVRVIMGTMWPAQGEDDVRRRSRRGVLWERH